MTLLVVSIWKYLFWRRVHCGTPAPVLLCHANHYCANHSSATATDRPGPPEGPVETVESTSSVIEIKWKPPKDDGGSAVTSYTVQRRQDGQNLWTNVGDILAEKTSFRDRNVTHGKKYNYRICAANSEGVSDALETTDSIMAGVMSECTAKKTKAWFARHLKSHAEIPQEVIHENASSRV